MGIIEEGWGPGPVLHQHTGAGITHNERGPHGHDLGRVRLRPARVGLLGG